MIKVIAFDVWNTIARKTFSTTDKMIELLHLDIPKKQLIKILEESLQTKKWESQYDAYKNLCKNIGIALSDSNITLLQELRDKAEMSSELFPHTISMIKQLKGQSYKIGLVSNSTATNISYLQNKTELLNLIDYPVFSFNVGVIKPNPKIFEKMIEQSLHAPHEILMIGDKIEDDIIPAQKIGMNAMLYVNYEQLKKDLLQYNINLI